uniref:Nitroreductase domain-containing protein n=1 Tax=Hemiselmis andersenii TaxID=464988 RepID=A0A6U2G0D4_HEMAN|mmetsp:Transcript_34493/g.80826  ORF Transcript_34493/g.80826 Transcript_34493/m.80826 type:complete len:279 (-) Transcript_34493:243-1079(-)
MSCPPPLFVQGTMRLLDVFPPAPQAVRWLCYALLPLVPALLLREIGFGSRQARIASPDNVEADGEKPADAYVQLLPCIRSRRSVFPKSYVDRQVKPHVMKKLLEAAMWAPFHGPRPPWRFVVLGRKAMIDMQRMTLNFYDNNWRETPRFGDGTEAEYLSWRKRTEEEILGRWGPVSYMVAIVMQRQAGSKRMPEWEEAAAVACAVQNMHLQASAFPGVACYWSSWHAAARDSEDMRVFLGMGAEDKCLGYFIVAACEPTLKDFRERKPETHLSAEWRD